MLSAANLYSMPSISWHTDTVFGGPPYTVSVGDGFSQGIDRLTSPSAVYGQ
jgi:hypothetical protein